MYINNKGHYILPDTFCVLVKWLQQNISMDPCRIYFVFKLTNVSYFIVYNIYNIYNNEHNNDYLL